MEGDAPWQVAVIGAGAIGLTTALTLAERGLDVTIYAKDLPAHAPSAWATGVWSPSSRIGLESAVPDSFTEEWLAWGRYSLARHEQFVGALGDPVELRQSFILRDDPRPPSVPSTRDFLHLGSRVRNPGPRMRNLEAHEHPFNVAKARGGIGMSFNIARYTESLVSRFYQRGGQIIQREFHDLNAVQALDETVIVNCTGYGAKALWGDDSLSPVRGQINWFPPHKGERYSLYYSNIFAIARTDGTLVQYTGPNDDYGFGVEDLTPDIGECERTIATLASVF
jgi:glycine/D-amino acid oxidase-like deaminating enzyme